MDAFGKTIGSKLKVWCYADIIVQAWHPISNSFQKNGGLRSHGYPRQPEQHQAKGRVNSILASGSRSSHLCDFRILILWLFLQVGFIFSYVDQHVPSCWVETCWLMPLVLCILNLHLLERLRLDCGNLHFQNHEKGFNSDMVGCATPQPSTVKKGQSPCRNMKDRGRCSIYFPI